MSPIPFNVLNTNKLIKKKNSFQSQMIKAAAIMGLATASVMLPTEKIPLVKNIFSFDLGNVEAASNLITAFNDLGQTQVGGTYKSAFIKITPTAQISIQSLSLEVSGTNMIPKIYDSNWNLLGSGPAQTNTASSSMPFKFSLDKPVLLQPNKTYYIGVSNSANDIKISGSNGADMSSNDVVFLNSGNIAENGSSKFSSYTMGAKIEYATMDGQIKDLPAGSVINFAGYQWTVLDPQKGYLLLTTSISKQAFDTNGGFEFDTTYSGNIGYYLNNVWFQTLPIDQRALIKTGSWGTNFGEDTSFANVGLLTSDEWYSYSKRYKGSSGILDTPLTGFWLYDYDVDVSDSPIGVYAVDGTTGTDTLYGDTTKTFDIRPVVYIQSTAQVVNGTVVINSAPTVSTIPNQTTSRANPITVNLGTYFTDPDGDPMTYTATSSDTTKATVSITGSQLTLTPKALGTSTIMVTANDGHGHTTNTSFTITVANQVPTISLTNSTTNQFVNGNQKVMIQGTVSDADNDNLTVQATIGGIVQTANVSGNGTFTLQWDGMTLPEGDYSNIPVTVSDGYGGSNSATYSGKITLDRTPPAAPARFRKGDVTSSTAILQWDAVADNATYTIYRDGVQIYNGTALTFLDTGVNPNKQYNYSIKATVNSLDSIFSATKVTTLSSPVSNIAFSEKDYSSFRVSWGNNGNPDGTEYLVTVKNGAVKLGDSGWITDLTRKINNLNPNTNYTVEISARNSDGIVSQITSSTIKTDPLIINPVTNLQLVTNDSTQVKLTWDATTQPNMNYVIEKYSGSSLVNTFSSDTNQFVDTDVKPKNQYTYKVKIRSKIYGNLSDPVSITANIPLPPAPLAPQNVSVDSITENSFNVKWDVSSGVNLYYVEVLDNGVRAAFTSTTSLSTAITGLKAGKQYTVNVYGIDAYGQKTNISTTSANMAAPAPIVNFTTINSTVTGSDVALSWDSVTGAYGYYVERYDNGVKKFRQYVTKPTYTDSNVPAGDHEYRVYSYTNQGILDPVNKTVTVGTVASPPSSGGTTDSQTPVQNLNAAVNGTSVVLNWDTLQGTVYGYYVERWVNGVRQLRTMVSTNTYIDTNAPIGNVEYRVIGYTKEGGLLQPTAKTVTIAGSAAAPITPVQNLKSTVTGSNVSLSWDAENVYGYYVERYNSSGTREIRQYVTTNSFVDSSVKDGQYTYKVIAYSKDGMTDPTSNNVTIGTTQQSSTQGSTPSDTLADTVTSITPTINGTSVSLDWNDVNSVYGYYVERWQGTTKISRTYVTNSNFTENNVTLGDYTYKIIVYSQGTRGFLDPVSIDVSVK